MIKDAHNLVPLMDFDAVRTHFSVAETTLRRWISESRRGIGTFPKPVNLGNRRKLLFNRSDIESFCKAQPPPPQEPVTESPTKLSKSQAQQHAAAMADLAELGVKVGQ